MMFENMHTGESFSGTLFEVVSVNNITLDELEEWCADRNSDSAVRDLANLVGWVKSGVQKRAEVKRAGSARTA